jgi:hypothetical protein
MFALGSLFFCLSAAWIGRHKRDIENVSSIRIATLTPILNSMLTIFLQNETIDFQVAYVCDNAKLAAWLSQASYLRHA